MRLSRSVVLTLVVGLASANAFAQGAPDQVTAEALFQQGKALLEAKRAAAACPKLAESLRLDPGAGGTQLLLAVCHEEEGKIATAWAELSETLAIARRDNRADREKIARDRIAALEPRLPRLVVRLAAATASLPGLQVARDGVVLGSAVWGTATPVDPGEHEVVVTAPGHAAFRRKVTATVSGSSVVDVPPLDPAVTAPTPSTAGADVQTKPEGSGRKTGAIVAFVAGGIALGVGGYFAISAAKKHGDVTTMCPGGACPTEAGKSLNDESRTAARVANIGLGLGLIGAGIGTYLLVTTPPPSAGARLRFVPLLGGEGGGAAAFGTFE